MHKYLELKCLSHNSGSSINLLVFKKKQQGLASLDLASLSSWMLINLGPGFITDDDLVDVHEVH